MEVDIEGQVRAELSKKKISHNKAAEGLGMSRTAFENRLSTRTDFRVKDLIKICDMVTLPFSEFARRAEERDYKKGEAA